MFAKQTVNSLPSCHPALRKCVAFTLAEFFSPHCASFRKTAFTLAEVLITLGIIGVVAAITMPNLIANHQKKQTATQLKKVYSTLNQAFKMAEVEHGESENWTPIGELNTEEYFNKYLKPYIKVLKLCKNYRECNYNNMTPWIFLNNERCQAGMYVTNNSITFMLPDGTVILYMAFVNELGYDTTHTIVDINGPKGPNKFGRDVFRFDRVKGKGFVPTTSDTNYCTENSNGVGCAQKIMEDGWEIAPDYPW